MKIRLVTLVTQRPAPNGRWDATFADTIGLEAVGNTKEEAVAALHAMAATAIGGDWLEKYQPVYPD
jgi:hypothetical protein